MKKQGKRQAFCCMAAAAMLAMSACGQVPAVEQGGSPPQAPEENAESQMPERTLSETVLLSGKETQVFLEIGDEKIVLWDQPAGGEMLRKLPIRRRSQMLPKRGTAVILPIWTATETAI